MTNPVIHDIINILLYNNIYNIYYKYIYNNNINNKTTKYILELIKELYEKYPDKEQFTLDDLQLFLRTVNPGLTEKQAVEYDEFFKACSERKTDPELAKTYLEAFKKQQVLTTLSTTVWDVLDGSKEISSLHEILGELDAPIGEVSESDGFVNLELESLISSQVSKPGLRWRLKFLNLALGSLRKGDFGFLFARPETGKTTFLASEITFMAEQLSEEQGPILWLNNEEQGEKVGIRLVQASLGKTLADLRTDPKTFGEEYKTRQGHRIKLVDRPALYKRDVEKLLEKYKPSLVIFDQIDKVKGFDNDREDLRLGSIYLWARELAKTYCPVIGVCQADVSGEGQKWLTMDNVANAKTSKQAEADWILGIGVTHDPALRDIRYLNISKNKLIGDEDSLPDLRHGRCEVLIEPQIARYKDLM